MKIIYWDDLIKEENLYPQGSAISVGGFDGPHRGHERILSAVLEAARRMGIPAGIITFFRSPRSVKDESTYSGDVSTLDMRLQKFMELMTKLFKRGLMKFHWLDGLRFFQKILQQF